MLSPQSDHKIKILHWGSEIEVSEYCDWLSLRFNWICIGYLCNNYDKGTQMGKVLVETLQFSA